MTKTVILILSFATFSVTTFSQDLTLKCGEKEIECENGNKDHFDMVMYCPYEETDTTKLPQIVLDNAKQYLTARVGQNFFHVLNYYECQIVNFKKFAKIKKQKGWVSEKSDKRVKYAIQYYFIIQDSLRYYLTIVFDKDGKIISKDQLPSVSKNKQFDKILNVCDAKAIAEQDKVFTGELQNISLEYLGSANTFVWRIEKPAVKEGKKRQRVRRFLLVNANSGKVIKRETEIWTIACELQAF